jgi:hypothetical protein
MLISWVVLQKNTKQMKTKTTKTAKAPMKKFLLNHKGNKYKADTLIGIVINFMLGKKTK